ncbi:hypothetical protein PV327_007684 [Microctonus hyperodae]|uniref:Methyltransferase type 11 domain-containing protein n=1 Tax=Microctonus hyperodae TaxID=165561 RepID=A0AA39G045_MICHY|nr:hypothetical protein PV327_007684 [Microctonus hyperodae]
MRHPLAREDTIQHVLSVTFEYKRGIFPVHQYVGIIYRSHLLCFEAECAYLSASYKKHLFAPLNDTCSNDEILQYEKCIRVVEIGVRTGENIQYYPDGTHFVGVDWNRRLKEYLTRSDRAWQFSHINIEKLIIGDGSSLRGIPNDCVDAVVTVRSLCSTSSTRSTLDEIQRVLAPGGKYFFLEHVPDKPGTLICYIQRFLTKTRIWPSLFGDCRLDSNPINEIENTKFKDVIWKPITLCGYVSQPYKLYLTRNHIMGTATK